MFIKINGDLINTYVYLEINIVNAPVQLVSTDSLIKEMPIFSSVSFGLLLSL
jgi:hypothetical protein